MSRRQAQQVNVPILAVLVDVPPYAGEEPRHMLRYPC